jgi:MtN3 and saliva related transmembrane protein
MVNNMDGKFISEFLYGAALFFNASLFIPQAWRIFKEKRAEEVDLITFCGFNVIQLLGFIDGLYNQDYALVIGQAISFLACALVTVQLLYYKINKKKLNSSSQL